jgi:hypothetical protein
VGVFISKGMRLRVPAGGLTISIGDDGQPMADLVFEVSLDMWPSWLEIASTHAAAADDARSRLVAADRADGEAIGALLAEECREGMVAMAAAAIAIDAFYGSMRERVDLSSLDAKWTADTPRTARVFEGIRRAFVMTNTQAGKCRRVIREIYKFRDWAVHPPASFSKPVKHDLLEVGVEWRYVAFGAPNAVWAAANARDLIRACLLRPRPTANLGGWPEEALAVLGDGPSSSEVPPAQGHDEKGRDPV